MKKTLSVLMLSMLSLSSVSFAEEIVNTTNVAEQKDLTLKEKYKLACSNEELNQIIKKSMTYSNESSQNVTLINFDTIKYDKKTKMVNVWISYISKDEGRSTYIENLGQNYSNYGYTKMFKQFDIKNKKVKILDFINYDCSGTSIDEGRILSWDNIVPDSIDDLTLEELKSKIKTK
jgi:hypothetical protein